MPPLPYYNGLVKVVVNGVIGTSKPWANIFHVLNPTGPVPTADLASIATQFGSTYGTRFVPLLSPAVSTTNVEAIDLSNALGGTQVVSAAHTGTSGSAGDNPAGAFLLNWKIGRHYRGGHPRTYLPGPSSTAANSNGVVVSGTQTSMTTAAAGLISDIAALTMTGGGHPTLVCVHYHQAKTLLTTPLVDAITDGVCNPTLATQRRRLR